MLCHSCLWNWYQMERVFKQINCDFISRERIISGIRQLSSNRRILTIKIKLNCLVFQNLFGWWSQGPNLYCSWKLNFTSWGQGALKHQIVLAKWKIKKIKKYMNWPLFRFLVVDQLYTHPCVFVCCLVSPLLCVSC